MEIEQQLQKREETITTFLLRLKDDYET
jgi:hypothetical protein